MRTWDFSACEQQQRPPARRRRAGGKSGAAASRNAPHPDNTLGAVEEDAEACLSRSVPANIGSCLASPSPCSRHSAASSSEGRHSFGERAAGLATRRAASIRPLPVPGDRARRAASDAAGGGGAAGGPGAGPCHRSGGGGSCRGGLPAPPQAVRSPQGPCAPEDEACGRCGADGRPLRGRPDMHTMQIVRPRPVGVSSAQPSSPASPPCHAIRVVS